MIKIAISLSAYATYKATGTQTDFTIPFDYLRSSFVYVDLDGVNQTKGFTIFNGVLTFATAPAKDTTVTIYRNTPTERLVSWQDASILKARDLTLAEVQQLHLIEENKDYMRNNAICLDDTNTVWQGKGKRIENVADPINDQDVVTKKYIEDNKDSLIGEMTNVKDDFTSFIDYKTDVIKEAEAYAKLYAERAATSEANAKASEERAEAIVADIDRAVESANAAEASAAKAKQYAEETQQLKDDTISYANRASASAQSADSSADSAISARDSAEGYAAQAKNYSENVNVYTPYVSTDGVLSWTNKAGLANPTPVPLRGRGATVSIGTVQTGEAGTLAKVTNSGTSTDAILNFTIPRGEKGNVGVRTIPTASYLPTVGESNMLYIVVDENRLYYWDSSQETYVQLSGGSVTYETYEGTYEATSKTNEDYQLGTANKYLEEDIIVKGIPYSEIPNTSNGLTVTIGEGN